MKRNLPPKKTAPKPILENVFEKYNIAFHVGDPVYLITDAEQQLRYVTGITIRQDGLTYGLTMGVDETWHYDFELSTTKTY